MTNNQSPKQTVLERLHKKSISAKDIANQFWCEKQMELYYTTEATPTAIMNKGSAIHERLQVEVYKPLQIEPQTWPDRMYKQAYENIMTLNTLIEKKIARELKIYGSINGYTIAGQIDEIRMVDGKAVVVENKTTRMGASFTPAYVKPHNVQIMLYRKMLQELREGAYKYQNLEMVYRMSQMSLSENFRKGLKDIGVKEELMTVSAVYNKMFNSIMAMPEISDSLILHYFDRESNETVAELTIAYNKEELSKELVYALKYWNGEREAMPVDESEKWKCRICRFYQKKCFVWAPDKGATS